MHLKKHTLLMFFCSLYLILIDSSTCVGLFITMIFAKEYLPTLRITKVGLRFFSKLKPSGKHLPARKAWFYSKSWKARRGSVYLIENLILVLIWLCAFCMCTFLKSVDWGFQLYFQSEIVARFLKYADGQGLF